MAHYIPQNAAVAAAPAAPAAQDGSALRKAIVQGLGAQAAAVTRKLLAEREGLAIVQQEIIPALDAVGRGFEQKTVYLPQLLMSAEAAGAAFEEIKAAMTVSAPPQRSAIVLATVQGDIHDIGKNILKLLLENYGFTVTDLGRDVSPADICEAVVRLRAPMVGLSALMTTTVPAMAETIALLREKAPWAKVMVGGAVLTRQYADSIDADGYGHDAMAGVRLAEEWEKAL